VRNEFDDIADVAHRWRERFGRPSARIESLFTKAASESEASIDFLTTRTIGVGHAEDLIETRRERLALHDGDGLDRERQIELERSQQAECIDACRDGDAIGRQESGVGFDAGHPIARGAYRTRGDTLANRGAMAAILDIGTERVAQSGLDRDGRAGERQFCRIATRLAHASQRPAGRYGGDALRFDQRHRVTFARQRVCRSGAGYPTSDDDDVRHRANHDGAA
jgi:hypothetical protein